MLKITLCLCIGCNIREIFYGNPVDYSILKIVLINLKIKLEKQRIQLLVVLVYNTDSLDCDSAGIIALLFQLHVLLCSKGQVLLGKLDGNVEVGLRMLLTYTPQSKEGL